MADNDDGSTLPKLSLKKPGEPPSGAAPPLSPPTLQPPAGAPGSEGEPKLTLSKPGGDNVISLKKPGQDDGGPPKLTLRKPGGEAVPASSGAPAIRPSSSPPPVAAPPPVIAAPPAAPPPSLSPPPSLAPPPIKPSAPAPKEEDEADTEAEAASPAAKKKPKITLPDFKNMDKKQKIIVGAVAALVLGILGFLILGGGSDAEDDGGGEAPPAVVDDVPAEEDELFGDLDAAPPPELVVGPSDPTEVNPNEWALKAGPGRVIIRDNAIFEAVEDAFTISFWVKGDDLPVDGSVFLKGGESAEVFRVGLRKTAEGMKAEFATAAEPDRILSAVAPAEGWIHLSAVYAGDAKKVLLLFINGSRMATETSRQLITPACDALVVEVDASEGEALIDDIHVANSARYLRHFRPLRKQRLDANSVAYIHLEKDPADGPIKDRVRSKDIALEGADWANIQEEIKMSDVLANTVVLPHHVFLKVKENFPPADLDKFMQTWASMDSTQRVALLADIGQAVE